MPATRNTSKRLAPLTETAKLTSKGQITLPVALRRRLGVKPGDRIVFSTKGSDVVIALRNLDGVLEKYRGIGTGGIGTTKEEILKWIRDFRGDL